MRLDQAQWEPGRPAEARAGLNTAGDRADNGQCGTYMSYDPLRPVTSVSQHPACAWHMWKKALFVSVLGEAGDWSSDSPVEVKRC